MSVQDTAPPGRPGRGALFWLVLLIAAYFVPRGIQANADSHLAVSYEIVEHGSIRVDRYAPYLLDKAAFCAGLPTRVPCRHFYGDKAPGISILAAALYLPLHTVLPAGLMPSNPAGDRFLLRYLLTLATISLGCAIFAVTYWRFLAGFVGDKIALIATLGYSFGTMTLPFTMLLFSHALTAALMFWAFMMLYGLRQNDSRLYRQVVPAGMLAGYGVACEYPAALIAALLGLYALALQQNRAGMLKAAVAYAYGLVAGFAPAVAYNITAFGSPFAPGYTHLTDAYYARGMSRGIFGVGLPSWESLWGTTFSPYRGLFFLSPWLLLVIPGLVKMLQTSLRREAALCAAIILVYFLFQAGYAFWDGGASVGPRHFLPALPFMVFPIAFALSDQRIRAAACVLIALSSAAMILVVSTNPLFGDPHYAAGGLDPLVDQTLHDAVTGAWQNNWGMVFGLHGALSLMPLAVAVTIAARSLRRAMGRANPGAAVASDERHLPGD